jgi:hypothetical protein
MGEIVQVAAADSESDVHVCVVNREGTYGTPLSS